VLSSAIGKDVIRALVRFMAILAIYKLIIHIFQQPYHIHAAEKAGARVQSIRNPLKHGGRVRLMPSPPF
jgi:hypothetical protein